jgi:hypothetical protein
MTRRAGNQDWRRVADKGSLWQGPWTLMTPNDEDFALIRAFLGLSKNERELDDESGNRLFGRALEALGSLGPDEMSGFEPAIVLGGKLLLDNFRKVKLDQHLTILRQLALPAMLFSNIDIDKLIAKE